MQENLAFLQSAKKPNAKARKITEAILKVQDNLNKNNLGVQEKDIDNNLSQIWDFFFTLIKNNSLSIQNSIERCADIFIMRNYSFYPEKIEKLLISQIKCRKNISDKKQNISDTDKKESKDTSETNKKDNINEKNSDNQNEAIIYDPSLAKYDNLLLQIFTIISPKISSMRIDSFLENCKVSGIFSIFSMKGNPTINNTIPKYVANLKSLGIEWHIDLLSSFLSEKVEYAQIKSINAIIDNYPSLFGRVLSTNNYSLISFILSIHNNNSNDIFSPNISSRYFSNLNNFPRTDDLINSLYKSTTVSDIDNFLMILSCDKDVKIKIETKKENNEEENQEEEEEESENSLNIDNKIVKFYSTSKFSRDLPLNQVISRSSFYNFTDIPFKYLLPRESDSVFILTVKFQKIAQRATVINCKKIFSIFNHFLNERKNQNPEGSEAENDISNSTPFYDELTSACLQNLPICINVFSVLPDFPLFLKKVLLVKPASWLHASDISRVIGSLSSVHFNQIGGLTTVITKLLQFSMSSNKQLSNNAIESIVHISNINNCDKILHIIYNSFDDFDSQKTMINLCIASKLVEKNNFYFCILSTFLERILEISMLFPNDLLLLSEILHFTATIKNKTKLSSYSSNSFIVDESRSLEATTTYKNSFSYGKNLKYLKDTALSLIYAYIQFFTGNSNCHPPQSLHNSIESLYSLLLNYINSSDFDQIQFTFLFNAFDFLTAFPSTDYKTLALVLCDDLINVFPKEVSEFAVKYPPHIISQSFYKAFDYFSNSKDIEVSAIWCNVFFKITANSSENSANKQLDDKVSSVFEKMADFAFASPTRVSKYCLNTLSLYLLRCSPSKDKLRTLVDKLSNKEAKQSTLLFLYKEDEAEFNFLFPNIETVKGTKLKIKFEGDFDDSSSNNFVNNTKRKNAGSDDYSDDDDDDDESDFDHNADLDSDSFSDKSQQNEFSFTFNKVEYTELLENYTLELKNEDEQKQKETIFLTKNYLILTQLKYSLVNFTTEQLKTLITNYFNFNDYDSLFTLIIYCMRCCKDFPFNEFNEQFKITPFKNLSVFLSKLGNIKINQKVNKSTGIPTSVVSLTSAYLINKHIAEDDNDDDDDQSKSEQNSDIFDQFLYYYDRFVHFYDKRESNFTLMKETNSIDHLTTNTTESSSSMSSKQRSSSNDRNGLASSKNNFAIRYLYEENEFDINALASILPSSAPENDHIFSPLSLPDTYSCTSTISRVILIKRILELLSLSDTIKKTIKNEKLSKKPLKRILSCIPFVNKSFLDKEIDLLEFALIVFSKSDKKVHMKFALLVFANIANRMKSPWKEFDALETIKERSKSEKEKATTVKEDQVKRRSLSLKMAPKPFVFEKNFVINDNFIDNFFSIVRENSELLPREELIICVRMITEKTICQEDSKFHEIVKSISTTQQELISPSCTNITMSLVNFTTKLENIDFVGIWMKLLSFKGIPSFFIRGCSLIYHVMMKTIQMTNFTPLKNTVQAIFDARKEFFNGMSEGINSLLNIFTDFDNALSTSAVDMAKYQHEIYKSSPANMETKNSPEQVSNNINSSVASTNNNMNDQNISMSQPNLKKNNDMKYNSQNCTCNYFVDKVFYNCSFLILSSSSYQPNIYSILKQYECFIVDPRRAEFELDSEVLPYLIKKLNTSSAAIKRIQTYVSSFILPKHVATVNYKHHNSETIKNNSNKGSSEKVGYESESDKPSEGNIGLDDPFEIGGFDIIPTSILPVYLRCIIEIYNIVPDSLNNVSSRIINNLLERLRKSKDFDSFYFSDFIWKWIILIAQHSGIENALNLSCTTFPNFLPRFFPLFAAIVKFVKTYQSEKVETEMDNINDQKEEEKRNETFKNFLSNAALVSQEKSKAHGFAFSLLADDKRIKDALDLAQFDHDCVESDVIISHLQNEKETGK